MKPERAQELYSDYAEGTLAPALRQALEQHFEADPSARADYARFARVYTLLERPLEAEVEVPLGLPGEDPGTSRGGAGAARNDVQPRAPPAPSPGWFSTVPHRRMTGGALAGLAAAALLGCCSSIPARQRAKRTTLYRFRSRSTAPADPAVIQKVDTAGRGRTTTPIRRSTCICRPTSPPPRSTPTS